MKVLHVNFSLSGGAGRAAYRLHRAFIDAGIESQMLIKKGKSDDWTVLGPANRWTEIWASARAIVGKKLTLLQRSTNSYPHSVSFLPSRLPETINASEADVVNLHWVTAETMSVEDVARIRKPIVWTFHDMWPFCGAEHLVDADDIRWRQGYFSTNRPSGHSGLDIDRWVWRRKLRAWKNPIQVVTPSRWLKSCAVQSKLMHNWSITTIPNVINTDVFKPLNRDLCRMALNLPSDKQLILFGALGGVTQPIKGFDLLQGTLKYLAEKNKLPNAECLIFGQREPEHPNKFDFPVRWMGHIHDDVTLALLYSSADVMVVPSRQENLPQTATEAHACGCPVVAFNTSGLPDVVLHKKTGYLAEPYSVHDLASGIEWVLHEAVRDSSLTKEARKRALDLWCPKSVLPQYLKVYNKAVATLI